MKPADLGLLRIPGLPTLSPDGSRAIVAVSRPDLDEDEYVSQLWLVQVEGDEPPRQLTQGRSDSGPRFSPDGRHLAFVRKVKDGKPQLYVMPTDGGEPRQVTDHPVGAGPAQWRPDSGALAYCARVPEDGRYGTTEGVTPDKERPRRITTLEYRRDGVGFLTDRRTQVFVVDPFAEEPEPVQVTSADADADNSEVTWSPDGSLAGLRLPAPRPDADFDLRSRRLRLPAGRLRPAPDHRQHPVGGPPRLFIRRRHGLLPRPRTSARPAATSSAVTAACSPFPRTVPGKSRRLTDAEE